MKLTKLKIDAPRMHGIEIESGIKKKTVGTKYVCVKYILLAQNSLGMTQVYIPYIIM